MFADLQSKELQPQEIDVRNVPDIKISESLRNELKNVLEDEEGNFSKVSDKTAVVQTDKNYVFFSNQWLYLAVLCKKYAENLKPYGDFFDNHIRGNQRLISILVRKDYDNPEWISLLPEQTDRERMLKFIESDSLFRPGKALLNGDKPRSVKDIFGSCILKKISVPDASSAYLGNLVFYLAKRPKLYDKLEREIKNQIECSSGAIRLSKVTKECAKQIIDCIYRIDSFSRLEDIFEANEKNIKINIAKTEGVLPNGNFLRYLFALPNSDLYSSGDGKDRVFYDTEYSIRIGDNDIFCRLTTEWVDSDIVEGKNGNYLKALIVIVNKYYADYLSIKSNLGERYMYLKKEKLIFNELPECFRTDFTRRYITSLLAKPFVILTGNSGTGKTRISKQFSEYLECEIYKKNDEGKDIVAKNWMIVPVGADWTDNSKVLGFYNPLGNEGTGKYEKTKIIELIEDANANPTVPFFLVLDEMNLSHVERYFADFLSHMETPDTPFQLDGYQGELQYPDNLFVVGTVNIDETTYMFSPKVLDRANVIEFKPQKKEVLAVFDSVENLIKVNPAGDGSAQAFLKLAQESRKGNLAIELDDEKYFEPKDRYAHNVDYIKNVVEEIYEITEKSEFEFAYRTVKEIKNYISAAYELADLEKNYQLSVTLDEQLVQKVLPKIHGNKKEIQNLLDELLELCEKYHFELSSKKITQMKGKLDKVQYASFI